ncbi:hypothetical protein HMPREF9373_2292 [Psychrobacter sp. 1501(2011)]|nr:hypothetical protein HMPREF9373_2292 [Psychrobacter sp. 1501(2011)]
MICHEITLVNFVILIKAVYLFLGLSKHCHLVLSYLVSYHVTLIVGFIIIGFR